MKAPGVTARRLPLMPPDEASHGRYTMDDAARIAEMKSRGFTEAREQLPELRRRFFDREAELFVPFHSL